MKNATDSVIWINRAGDRMSKVCRPGSRGPREGDLVVDKPRCGAFIGTRLDMILRVHEERCSSPG